MKISKISEKYKHNHRDHFEDQHGHIHHHHSVKNLKVALVLNLTFTLIEVIGGFLTNSIAILSDALHDLGDTLAIGMSWYFQKLSYKSKSQKFSYGYKRLSLVSALFSAIILLVGSVLIVYKAIPRIFNPEAVHVKGMFVIAIIGVLAALLLPFDVGVRRLALGKRDFVRMWEWVVARLPGRRRPVAEAPSPVGRLFQAKARSEAARTEAARSEARRNW